MISKCISFNKAFRQCKIQHLCKSSVYQSNSIRCPGLRMLSSLSSSTAVNILPQKKRVLSGVQPTGSLHIGNYIGALRQWVPIQDKYDCFFCVVDLHAITVPHDPKKLRQETIQAAAMYIACGIDPQKSKIFIQSHVSAHAELAWILNCITPMSWLEKMVQYKEKGKIQGANVSVGLFDYPVLMAADILLYRANLVPVGEDQRQHLELARDISQRYNDLYGKHNSTSTTTNKSRVEASVKTLVEPSGLIVPEGARIMSLLDGKSKMSKSAESEGSRINLLDSPDIIFKKFKRCKTDSIKGLEWNNPSRPECTNLLNIYQSVTNKSKEDILAEVTPMSWSEFKPLIAEAVIQHLRPIQERYKELISDSDGEYLSNILKQGEEAARNVAETTLQAVKDDMGFLSRKRQV